MILAVLMLGGAMLGVTAIAGLLMLYQIRQSTDYENSAKAIFAADAGVEWALQSYFKPPAGPLPGSPPGTLENGAVVSVTCYDNTNSPVACSNPSSTYAISEGSAGGTKRAFFVGMSTSTFP